MTSTGLPPGSVVPIPLAPNLDPSDLAHVPRWLASLAEAEANARYWLTQDGRRPRMAECDMRRLEACLDPMAEAERRANERPGGGSAW